jgi:hypothetical protein
MFDVFIHHHHAIEENTIWPYFKAHGVPFDDKMYDDHKHLLQQQHEIVKLSTLMLTCDGNNIPLLERYADELRTMFTKVKDGYEEHFAEEEESAELIKKILTKDEWDTLEKGIVNEASKFNKAFISFGVACRGALRWGGNEAMDSLMSGMPWPIKYLATHNWINAFIAEYLYPLLSIQLNEQPVAPIRKWLRPGILIDYYFPQDTKDRVPSVKAKRQGDNAKTHTSPL